MSGRRNVALIGFMGAGKSTVGRAVSERTGLPLIDFDERIASSSGMTIAEIFARFGEPHFRRLETELLRDAVARTGRMLIPGGGIVLREENRRLLRRGAHRIWLRIGPEEARRRLRNRDEARPLLGSGEDADLAALIAGREPHYRECDEIIDVEGRTLAEVVEAVIASIERSTLLPCLREKPNGKTLDMKTPEI